MLEAYQFCFSILCQTAYGTLSVAVQTTRRLCLIPYGKQFNTSVLVFLQRLYLGFLYRMGCDDLCATRLSPNDDIIPVACLSTFAIAWY